MVHLTLVSITTRFSSDSGSRRHRHLGIHRCMGRRHKTCIRCIHSCMGRHCSICHSKQPLAQPHACAACIRSFHNHKQGWHNHKSMECSCIRRTSGHRWCHRSKCLGRSSCCSKHLPLVQPQHHACAACICSFHSHKQGWHSHKNMEHSCIHRTSDHSCHKRRRLGHSSGCSK